MDFAQFSALVALIIGGFGLFAFMFQRLETRLETCIDKLDDRMRRLIERDFPELRRDLAEEFRAQRAEVSAQVAAITNAIIASRKD